MGFNIERFATDSTLENEGVWVEAGSGLRLKIARLNNAAYEEELRKLGKPYVRQIRLGTMSNDVLETLNVKAVARHVLKGWEGLEDESGNEIKFTPQQAEDILIKYRDFFRLVMDFAQEQDLYRQEAIEGAEGNSKSA